MPQDNVDQVIATGLANMARAKQIYNARMDLAIAVNELLRDYQVMPEKRTAFIAAVTDSAVRIVSQAIKPV